jgi:hypothetical protein
MCICLLLLAVLLYCRIRFFSPNCLRLVQDMSGGGGGGQTHLWCCQSHFVWGPLVEVLGCNGLESFDDSGHLVNYKPQNMHNMGPNKCVGASSIFLGML